MWLPRDERRLLAGLAVKLRTVMDEQGFEMVSLLRLVQANFSTPIVPVASEQPTLPSVPSGTVSQSDTARIDHAIMFLRCRSLIDMNQNFPYGNTVYFLSLRLEGFDLGRKYARWPSFLNLYYQEHKEGLPLRHF